MGSGISNLCWCYRSNELEVIFTATEPLDETLGYSFCYVRSSNRFLSPTPSDRFISPYTSLRFSPTHARPEFHETGFKSISGASVSANSSIPTTVIHFDEDTLDCVGNSAKGNIVNGFESMASFFTLPLQPVPQGGEPFQVNGFFLSGPIESNAVSDPLPSASAAEIPFSAPLSGLYNTNKKKKGVSGFWKKFDKKRPWVVPVLNFIERKEKTPPLPPPPPPHPEPPSESNVQWVLGKAGSVVCHGGGRKKNSLLR